jgi:plasmid maintenance system antidote protein VapI
MWETARFSVVHADLGHRPPAGGILAERHALSTETALRIGKLCGNGPAIWLRMQQAYDLWQAERDMADELARIPTLTAA